MKVLIWYDEETKLWERIIGRNPGAEFERMAEACAKWYALIGCDVTLLSIRGKSALQKRQTMFAKLRLDHASYDRIIFFCHGHAKALNRNMISFANIETFCRLIHSVSVDNETTSVIFYSCNTAHLSDGGFAARVNDMTGMKVVGHSTSGHTSMNPNKFLFKDGDCISLFPKSKSEFKKFKEWLYEYPDNAFSIVEDALRK